MGGWAGQEGQPGWDGVSRAGMGTAKLAGWCAERWTISALELMRNPSLHAIFGHRLAQNSHYQSLYLGGQTKQRETGKGIEQTWEIQMIQLKG